MSNVAAAQAMYEAFGRGDVPAILALMSPDMAMDDWTNNTAVDSGIVASMRPRHGQDGAVAFFQALNDNVEFLRFDVTNMLAGSDQVAVTVSLEIRIKPTGKTVSDDMIHLWTFDAEGKATRFLHYLDTAKAIAAYS